MKEQKGFTLVELMVGITISSLLMIGVSVLVSNGIQNITGQREIIKNSKSENNFYLDIIQKINAGEGTQSKKTGSGFLLKQKKDFSKGGFSYIGTKFILGAYCTSTGSDFQNLEHLIIKDFIPFEGEGTNYFDDIVYKNGPITIKYNGASLEDGTILYTGSLLGPTGVYESGGIFYIADTKGHTIVKYTGGIFETIIGKGVPGNTFIGATGLSGHEVYLNNPTGITSASGGLFIADTLNNRVLRYEESSGNVYEYLSSKDGLSEPTGLYYDSGTNKLYISNAGKGEVLQVAASDSFPSSNKYSISFTPEIAANINNIKVSFFSGSLSSPVNITSPTTVGSVSFSGITQGEDLLLIGNNLHYYFASYPLSPESDQGSCMSNGEYILSGDDPIKCTMSGTGIVGTFDNKMLNILNNYDIEITNLSGNFSSNGTYFSKLELYNGSNLFWTKYHPFYTSGDGDINTISDNTIKVFASGLSYPTGIYMNGPNHLMVNDFFERKEYKFNINTGAPVLPTNNLPDFNFNNLSLSHEDIVFKNPIESFDVIEGTNLLTFKGKYYNDFSCIDGAKKGGTDFIFKKNLGN